MSTAGKKDVKRRELVKQYVHIPIKPANKASDFAAQNLPMVAMFLKNKSLAWATLFLAIQSWLADPLIRDPSDDSQPAVFKIIFALIAIATSSMDLFMPNMGPGAKAPAPASIVDTAVEAVTTAVETATGAATN
ncbi:unnamed protein product [Ambrosiozyma monospora]|uniref:Unnamed protein product n=1 Tax=Ambrosiozyma monospora TaxID=43982 RepID=A0A9W6YXE9_AMBMO|nr:unnamed protein product [Ambrosiozyma monospora]